MVLSFNPLFAIYLYIRKFFADGSRKFICKICNLSVNIVKIVKADTEDYEEFNKVL